MPNGYNPSMAKQDDYIKTALRIPKALHARLSAQAEAKGRSLNAEFIASLDGSAWPELPNELKSRLEAAAAAAGRSLNAELVDRLDRSFYEVPLSGLSVEDVIKVTDHVIKTLYTEFVPREKEPKATPPKSK